ncbi:MAG: hypothetical protein JXA41_04895 [Deltaproteobacteria bacterium]|nr:hypothetical protein [Deltaproteobacteria bacterium]
MKICHQCGQEVDIKKDLGRKETCPFCRADLRCCLNCIFYDPASYNACRETQAERVLDKDRSNFCEYFIYKDSSFLGEAKKSKENPLDKLNALFKK